MTYDMHNYAAPPSPVTNLSNNTKTKRNTMKNSAKYTLRQRQYPKRGATKKIQEYNLSDSDNSLDDQQLTSTTSIICESKKLSHTSIKSSNRPTKAKTKAAPLSKYRRKTANARERTRMREINSAFENLRQCVPHAIADDTQNNQNNEKLTKITTLRLAMKYIKLLSEALAEPNTNIDLVAIFQNAKNENKCLNSSESEFNMDYEEYTKINTITKRTSKTNKTNNRSKKVVGEGSSKKSSIIKRCVKKSKSTNTSFEFHNANIKTIDSGYNSSPCTDYNNIQSTTITTKLSYINPSSNYLLDTQNSLLLESDGESLHLSEHCLSPLDYNYGSILNGPTNDNIKPSINNCYDSSSINSNLSSLEHNLHLLDSPTESLSLNDLQQSPLCMSPLETLDALNDFMISDFPDNNTLDLYLT